MPTRRKGRFVLTAEGFRRQASKSPVSAISLTTLFASRNCGRCPSPPRVGTDTTAQQSMQPPACRTNTSSQYSERPQRFVVGNRVPRNGRFLATHNNHKAVPTGLRHSQLPLKFILNLREWNRHVT